MFAWTRLLPMRSVDCSAGAGALRATGRWLLAAALVAATLLGAGCTSTKQVRYEVAQDNIALGANDLEGYGMGFLTPAAATGRESDKQALALAFAAQLGKSRPGVKVVSLPEVLSVVNAEDLDPQYKRMYREYRETGVLDGTVLKRLGEVSGARYLGQLSVAEFQQMSRGRLSFLGLRILDTKQAVLRVFLQIWDSRNGSVAWEGSAELSYAYESVKENPAPFLTTATLAATRLYAELPGAMPP